MRANQTSTALVCECVEMRADQSRLRPAQAMRGVRELRRPGPVLVHCRSAAWWCPEVARWRVLREREQQRVRTMAA
jgi:hypothetical protein